MRPLQIHRPNIII